jgi:predicted metalloprotease
MRISPLRARFDAHPVEWNHWQKLYKKHQKEYMRSRLRMVKRGGNTKCYAPHPKNYRA